MTPDVKPLAVPPLDAAQVERVSALTARLAAAEGTTGAAKAAPLLVEFRDLTGIALDLRSFRGAKEIFTGALARKGPESRTFAECCLRHAEGAPPLGDAEVAGAVLALRAPSISISEGHYLLRRLERTFPGRPVAEVAVFTEGPIEAIVAHLRDGAPLPGRAPGTDRDGSADAGPRVDPAELDRLTALAERILDLLDEGEDEEADALVASFRAETGSSMSRQDFRAIPGAMRVRDAVEGALLAGRSEPAPRTRAALLDLVLRVTSSGPYEGERARAGQVDAWVQRLDDAVPYPHAGVTDLIFHDDLSPEEVVERLIRHVAPWGGDG